MRCSELADVVETIERCVGNILSPPEKKQLYSELLMLLNSSVGHKN